ncbi:MAG: TonB family protein, partial [Nitrospinaceae bacterium]
LRELEQLQGKLPAAPTLIEELEQVARLSPKPTVKKRKKPILDETFREQERVSPKKFSLKKDAVAPPVLEKLAEDLGKSDKEKEAPVAAAEEESLEELEFAALTPKPAELEKKPSGKTAAELLRELEKIEELEAIASKPPVKEVREPQVPPLEEPRRVELLEPIREKLGSLRPVPLEIDIDISKEKLSLEEFRSGLRKLKIPEKLLGKGVDQMDKIDAMVGGTVGADLLSLYIGEIYKRVYEKWRQPVGAKMEEAEVFVAFHIFPLGNIDKPDIRKSTGDENLDSLALRAVLDAEPFPGFPDELKVSNLHVTIHFKYIPEEN